MSVRSAIAALLLPLTLGVSSPLFADVNSAGWSLGVSCRGKGDGGDEDGGLMAAFRSGGFGSSGSCARTAAKFTRLSITTYTGGTLSSPTIHGVHTRSVLVLPPILTTEAQPVFAVASACPTTRTTKNLNWLFVQWTDEERKNLANTYVIGTARYHYQSGIHITGQYDVSGSIYWGGERAMPGSCDKATGVYAISGDSGDDINGNVYFTASAMGAFKTQAGRATFFFPSQTITLASDFGSRTFVGLNFDSTSSNGVTDVRHVTATADAGGTVITVQGLSDPEAGTVDASGTAFTDTITFTATNSPQAGALRANVTRTGFGAGSGVLACIANNDGGDVMLICSGRSPADPTLPYSLTLSSESIYNKAHGFDDEVVALALGGSGKTFASGWFRRYDGRYVTELARFNADGTLDTGFSMSYRFDQSGIPLALAYQATGDKLYAAGSFTYFDGNSATRIIRLDTNGDRDTSFVVGGGFNAEVRALALDSASGDIYAGGDFITYQGTGRVRLARLDSDGTLDTGFTVGTGFTGGAVNALAWDGAAGRLYVGGSFTSYQSNARPRLVKLDATGAEDTTFTLGYLGTLNGAISAMALDVAADRLYVAGSFTVSGLGSAPRLLCFTATTGAICPAFNITSGFDGDVLSLSLDTTGRLYAGGDFSQFRGSSSPRVVRIATDGTLDSAFAVGTGFDTFLGSVLFANISGTDYLVTAGKPERYQSTAIGYIARINAADGTIGAGYARGGGASLAPGGLGVEDGTGKVWAAGRFRTWDGTAVGRIARLNADGTLDSTLASGTGFDGDPHGMFRDPSTGKHYVWGVFGEYDGDSVANLIRLNTDGTLDSTYTSPGFNNAPVRGLIDASGNQWFSGNFASYGATSRIRVAKVLPSGAVDTSFAPTGASFDGSVGAIALDSAGKLLVGGEFTTYAGAPAPHVARLNSDGTFDPTFTPGTGANGDVSAIAFDSGNQKIYIGGLFSDYNGNPVGNIARLNYDGTFDSSFNQGTGFLNEVYELVYDPANDKLFVGGNFTYYDGGNCAYFARLDIGGTADAAFCRGHQYEVVNIQLDAENGRLYIAGAGRGWGPRVTGRFARISYTGDVE